MTFTAIARDPESRALGICLATSPLAVASRCPYVVGSLAAVSSQCYTNPKLGLLALDLLRSNLSPELVLKHLELHDEWYEWRQIGGPGVNLNSESRYDSTPEFAAVAPADYLFVLTVADDSLSAEAADTSQAVVRIRVTDRVGRGP